MPTWASKIEFFEAQVGLHFGGGLGDPGRHKPFFSRPKSLPKTPSKIGSLGITFSEQKGKFSYSKTFLFVPKKSFQETLFLRGFWEGSWASKKMVCGAQGRQDPPKMEANLDLEKLVFGRPGWRPSWHPSWRRRRKNLKFLRVVKPRGGPRGRGVYAPP